MDAAVKLTILDKIGLSVVGGVFGAGIGGGLLFLIDQLLH